MTNQPNFSCWEALQNLRDLGAGAPFVDCLFDLHDMLMAQENNAEMRRKQVTEKDKDIESVKSDRLRSEKVSDTICELDDLFNISFPESLESAVACDFAGDGSNWRQDRAELFTGKIERVMRHLQEVKNRLQGMPVATKEHNNDLEHTITIDGVVYYSAKHHKPKDGEAVTGYAKGNDCISYSCLGPVTSDPVWRPVPFTVWYEHDKSCWYTYDYLRQSDCKINVIAWTHLPHPKSAEEFQDFCNSL
jgi:hypothetical protein